MDIISQLAQAGYALFPLNGKKPAEKGDWRQTPINKTLTALDFGDNYGIVAGRRLIIDVDIKKGAKGKESFATLTQDLGLAAGWEAQTFVVRTGTGGFHIYLNVGGSCTINKHLKEYPGVEFLYGHCYAVGPGSVHPDTQIPYSVVFGSPEKLLDVPRPLLEKLLKIKLETITPAPSPAEEVIDDDPSNVLRFIEAISIMPDVLEGSRSDSIYIVACKGRDFGLSQAKCQEVIALEYNAKKVKPPVEDLELHLAVKNAYKYAKQHAGSLNVSAIFKTIEVGEKIKFGDSSYYDRFKNGQPKSTLNNAILYLCDIPQLNGAFAFNTFSARIEISPKVPWFKERGSNSLNLEDCDISMLRGMLSMLFHVDMPINTVTDAIVNVAHKRHYHPVQNYLKSLTWDGIPRIDTWLIKYGHALDTVYTRAIARKALCGAVRRVFEPGVKFDYVLVLEGAQGIGKSTACRVLGRNWSGDMNLDPHNKDAIHMMVGKWVIELSEMTALKWADQNALKSFLSRPIDTARLSYGHHAKDYERQCIFIGTVNPEHVGYLSDITGNRRYWVVRLNGHVDYVGLEQDCNQLWAEAFQVYKQEELYLTGEAYAMQVLETQKRMPQDPMRNSVIRWVSENPDVMQITPEAILEYLGVPMKSISRADQSRIAQSLTELGWDKKIDREGGVYVTSYMKPQRDQIDVLAREL